MDADEGDEDEAGMKVVVEIGDGVGEGRVVVAWEMSRVFERFDWWKCLSLFVTSNGEAMNTK